MIPPFRRDFDAARDPDTARYALQITSPADWTPTLTTATPGDLAVSYAASGRDGKIARIGRIYCIWFNVVTSSWTFTTASGNLQITGCPIVAASATAGVDSFLGTLDFGGITKAGYTHIQSEIIASTSKITFMANASATARARLQAADAPSGGTVILRGTIMYYV